MYRHSLRLFHFRRHKQVVPASTAFRDRPFCLFRLFRHSLHPIFMFLVHMNPFLVNHGSH